MSEERYVVEVRLLGQDKTSKKRRKKEVEYAIEVVLSDESQYTTYRTIKEIASFHSQLMSRFPVEAGYIKKDERVIPECPVKQTIFGPSRVVNDDSSFGTLLNSYIKKLPALPATIVKSDLFQNFFTLRASDISLPTQSDGTKGKKHHPIALTDDSVISGPLRLKSYYAVATYSDSKSKFSFSEGAVIQVMQKDASGWWMVDVGGVIGWAPASFLVPVDEGDMQEEAEENEQLVGEEKVGARYVSISSYQSSRDDELSFVRGAVVRVVKKHADGWWFVRYNGGEGYVPGSLFHKFDKRQATNYVKGIRGKFRNRKSTRIVPTVKPAWLSDRSRHVQNGNTKLMLYQCMANFSGSNNQSGFNLNISDVVKVLDKKEHGWWYVEDRHGRAGWAPATYFRPMMQTEGGQSNFNGEVVGSTRVVEQSYAAQQDDELSVEKGKTVTIISVSDDGWWIVRDAETQQEGLIPSVCLVQATCVEPSSSEDNLQDYLMDIQEESEDMPEDSEDVDITLDDCYMAVADYAAASVDEVDLYEGQVVCVIDDSDTDYWYVNVDGREGWLPSTLLTIMTEGEPASHDSSLGSSRDSTLDSHGASADDSDQSDSEDLNDAPFLDLDDLTRSRLRRSSPVIRREVSPVSKRPLLRKTLSANVTSESSGQYREQIRKSVSTVEKKSGFEYSSDSEVQTGMIGFTDSVQTNVMILIDNKSLEELEKEASEAEQLAQEAQRRARELRMKANRAGGHGYVSD